MGRVRTAAADLSLYAVGATIGLGVWALVSGGLARLPAAYDKTSPVVQFGWKGQPAVQGITRNESRICWTLFIEKLAPAVVKRYQFTVAAGDTSGDIDTAAYLVDGQDRPLPGVDADKLVSHPPGAKWSRRYCFDVAGRVPDFRPASISGFATHDRWPHLWLTQTEVPQFTVPAWRPL